MLWLKFFKRGKIKISVMSVILNFPSDKKLINARREIELRIKTGKFDTFIYIVPTRRKLRELRREFPTFADGEVMPELNLFTLELFARRLYFGTGLEKPKKLISDTIQSLTFQIAIENVIDELEYFRAPGQSGQIPKGTVDKIIDVIIGLKEDGVYPANLYDEIERISKKEEKIKLQDLVKIYEQYEGLLMSNGFIDVPGIFKELNDILNPGNVNSIFRSVFYNVDLIFIEGFSMFRLPETNFIKSLTNVADLSIVIWFDYFEKNNNLFGHLDECYNRFIDAGFKKYEIRPKTENDKFAKYLNKYLFNYVASGSSTKYDAKDFVTLIEARDRVDEVRTIARLIKKIVKENPEIELSKICVATYRPEKYTNLFREIFPIYGIPANITDRFYLERSPLVSAIVSLLEIPVNGYKVNEIVKVLMSPYFDFSAVAGRKLGPENIYSASIKLKIKSGRDFWRDRIYKRIEIVNAKLQTTNDEEEYEQLKRDKEIFERALSDFNELMRVVDEFSGLMTPSEFKGKLRGVLSKLKVNEQILKIPRKIASHDEIERDARAYQKFIEVIDELFEVFEFNMRRRDKYSLGYYVDLIKKALRRVRYNIRQKYGYGVYVTALEETRGLNFDVMIIAGLVDMEFPSVYEPEVFLSEGLKKTRKRHRLDERYLFYQGIVNFKTHLYLTYPRMNGENELVKSGFIDSLEQVIEFKKINSSELSNWIFSLDELYEDYGRFLKFNFSELGGFEHIAEKFPKLVLDFGNELGYIFNMSMVNISRGELHDENYSDYKGIVKPIYDGEIRELSGHGEKIFSISQIETYSKCPYRYFVERVLSLSRFEEIEELLTPIERGILYHEVLYEFYTKWRETGKTIADDPDLARGMIVEIALRKAKEFEISHPLWRVEVSELINSVNKFIDEEIKKGFDFKPSYFEVAFGPRVGSRVNVGKELSTTEPVQIGRVKIQGKIDRIDIAGNRFIIYDYKTGKTTPSIKEVEKGIHLQIPLYIKITEEIFKRKGEEVKGVGGYNYVVRGNVKRDAVIVEESAAGRVRSKAFKEEEFRRMLDETVNKVGKLVEGIADGRFNLTEHDEFLQKICGHCPYIEICRINEVKFGIQIKNWG